jgi:signal transduction histidine kinase
MLGDKLYINKTNNENTRVILMFEDILNILTFNAKKKKLKKNKNITNLNEIIPLKTMS